MNLIKRGLPDTVTIGGKPFFINTDYRVWMRFCNEFEKWSRESDLEIAYIFVDCVPPIQSSEDMQAILDFAYPPTVIPRGGGGGGRVIDYEVDADYIYSAFLSQYGIDLTETDMHWHKFRALLNGLNSSTRMYEIMGYRCYEGKDKEYIKLRNVWELPVELSAEENRQKEEFDKYFD